MTIWKLLMLLKVPWKDFKILLRHGEGWERNNNKMCSNFRDLRNDTNYWNQCTAFPLSLSVILYLAILSLYYHHCLNYISYSKDLQSQSSQSLPPANPSPKEEMQPTRGTKKVYRSSGFVDIWQSLGILTFGNKQTLKRQLNIFCVPTVLTRQDERGERFPEIYLREVIFNAHPQIQNQDEQLSCWWLPLAHSILGSMFLWLPSQS